MRTIDALLSSPSFRVYSRGIWLGRSEPFHSGDESAGWMGLDAWAGFLTSTFGMTIDADEKCACRMTAISDLFGASNTQGVFP
jgi:hypothetical protein